MSEDTVMDLHTKFAGTMYLPDKRFTTPGCVCLPDGQRIASIAWRSWSGRFSILDPSGNAVASCQPQGIVRRRYTVLDVDGLPMLDVLPGVLRPFSGMEVTLGSGRRFTVRRNSRWSGRRFELYDANGRLAGRIDPTTRQLSLHPDSYAFELMMPVMSALEAIALAQVLRLVVRAIRTVVIASS
jgi:hypothetical protein